MQPIDKPEETGNLEYGIIGRLKVQAVPKPVKDIMDEAEIERNIHTRRSPRVDTDVVVFGEPEGSARLEKYLPIGVYEKRKKESKYYVRDSLANEWGGVSNNGYIQMSYPAWLDNPERFFEWWERQNPRLIHKHNPEEIE